KQDDALHRSPLRTRRNSHRFHTFKDRFRLQDHAFAAAEWAVIHGTVPIFGKGPQIVNSDLNQARLTRPASNSVIERATKKVRKNRDNLNLHVLNGFATAVAPASLPRSEEHSPRAFPQAATPQFASLEAPPASNTLSQTESHTRLHPTSLPAAALLLPQSVHLPLCQSRARHHIRCIRPARLRNSNQLPGARAVQSEPATRSQSTSWHRKSNQCRRT